MRTLHNKLIQNFLLLLIPIFLTSCGGGGGGGGAPAPIVTNYKISGTIQGLTGAGLRLQNNLGEDIAVAPGTTTFTFPASLANGAAYSITVLQQPTGPNQICTVNRGSGNVSNADVTNIAVICSTTFHLVGGEVRGLLGSGLVIRNNNADSKPISANGPYTFTTPVATGAGYNVTVLTHPNNPSQKCVVSNGVGTVFRGDIANVIIDCNRSDQHFAYVANSGDGKISMYKVNALTGHLQTNGSVTTGANPEFITVDPVYPYNPYAYVVDRASSKISAYSIDSIFGTLTAAGLPVSTGVSPQPVTVDSTGRFAYVANSGSKTISVYKIDAAGRLTPAGTMATGISPQRVQVDPIGQYAYVANAGSDNVSGYKIDPATGALTPVDADPAPGIQNFAAGTNPVSVTIHPYGVYAYVANSGSNDISAYYLDFVGGLLVPIDANEATPIIENFAAGLAPRSVTIDPYGLFAYVANSGSNTISAYKIDVGSGRLISAGTIATGTSPQPVQVDPTGQFAYVANSVSHNVSGYKIDPATGALTSVGSPVIAGTDPRSVSFDALGHFAYVINNGSDTLSAYRIDGTTGVLTPVSGSPYAAELRPQAVTIDPSGQFAYVSNRASNTISAYAIDALTRALDPVPGSPFATGLNPQPVTVDPLFRMFAYVANSGSNTISAFSIGPSGELGVIATYPTGSNPQTVTIDPNGRFAYVANSNSNTVSAYVINGGTGALTPVDADAVAAEIQNFAAGLNPVSVTIDPLGKFAYVANSGSGTVSAYAINGTTGALTSSGAPPTGGISPQSVTVDPGGQFAYVANSNSNDIAAYTINSLTGVLTRIGTQNFGTPGSIAPLSVTIAPNGSYAYVANSGSGNVSAYVIDSTGALVPIGTVAAGTTPQAVVIDPDGKFAYVANSGSGNVSAYSIDRRNGTLIPIDAELATPGIQNFAAGVSPVTVSIGSIGPPSNRQLFAYVSNYFSSNVTAYTINADVLTPNAGVLTPVPGSPYLTGRSPTSIAITK